MLAAFVELVTVLVAANAVLAAYVYAFSVQPTMEVRVETWAIQDRELR